MSERFNERDLARRIEVSFPEFANSEAIRSYKRAPLYLRTLCRLILLLLLLQAAHAKRGEY